MRDMIQALPYAQGYSDSKGIMPARRAVFTRYELVDGFPRFDIDDVYLGNGVSELITMTLQALLDNGDQVLIPAPDYPLWTASTALAGGTPVHYLCDETQGWMPDIADLESKITERTKALVVINPNNPTGAVYSRENPHADGRAGPQAPAVAARRRDLRQDPLRRRQAHRDGVGGARPAVPDLQRAVQGLPGGRLPVRLAGDHRPEGTRRPASSRASACWPTCGCARMCLRSTPFRWLSAAIRASTTWCCPAGGCSSSATWRGQSSTRSPGCPASKPEGALYAFPRLDPEVHDIHDDEQLVLDLLLQEKILVTQGTGFNWPAPDHLRIVTLPWARDLANAIERLGNFLAGYRQ